MKSNLFFLFFIFFKFGLHAQDKLVYKKIDSLKIVSRNVKNDTLKVNLLNSIASEYNSIANSEAFQFANESIILAKKNSFITGEIDAYRAMGKYFYNKFDAKRAISYYNKAIKLSLKINDLNRLAKLYNMVGNTNMNSNDYAQALSNYLKAAKINENIKNEGNLCDNYSNIADIYFSLDAKDKFIKYINLSTIMAKKRNDVSILSFNYQLYVKYYLSVKDIENAEKYALKTLQLSKQIDETNGLAVGNIALGVVQVNKQNYPRAIIYFNKGLEYHQMSGNNMGIASVLNELGKCYFLYYKESRKSEHLTIAESNFLESTKIYLKENLIDGLAENYDYLAQISDFKKSYKDAFLYHKKYSIYKDSIFNSKSKETIKNLEDKRTIEVKEKQLKINQLQLQSKEKQKWLYIFGIGLLATIGGLLFYQSRNRKKTNEKLQLLNTELDQANKTKTRFFSILNHDLRGPVANLIHFLHLQKDNPELLDEETKNRMQNKTISGAENLLSSMEDILLWSKGQMENFKPKARNVEVNHLFDDTKKVFSGYHKIKFEYHNPDAISIFTDENYLKTIVRNLTSNAINVFTTTPNPIIIWKVWKENEVCYLSITDNGPGASIEQFKALYDDKEVVGIKSGLGLHLIRDLAKAINCEITVGSKENEGTTFVLKLNQIILI